MLCHFTIVTKFNQSRKSFYLFFCVLPIISASLWPVFPFYLIYRFNQVNLTCFTVSTYFTGLMCTLFYLVLLVYPVHWLYTLTGLTCITVFTHINNYACFTRFTNHIVFTNLLFFFQFYCLYQNYWFQEFYFFNLFNWLYSHTKILLLLVLLDTPVLLVYQYFCFTHFLDFTRFTEIDI